MSPSVIRSDEWLSAGFKSGCDRLVHPRVTGEGLRQRQRRLVGVLLGAPFLAAAAIGQGMFDPFGPAITLAAIFASFALFWCAALTVASTGRDVIPGISILAVAPVPAAIIIVGAGGMTSPLAALLVCFVLEAAWIWRTRAALLAGLAAMAGAAVALALLPGAHTPQMISTWHWLVPAAYALTLGLRITALIKAGAVNELKPVERRLDDIIEAVVFRLAANGDIVDATEKARTLLRLAPELLLGNGLFERIHVGDRVAYLCAVSELRSGGPTRTVDLRLRLPNEHPDQRGGNYQPFTIDLASSGATDGSLIGLLRSNGELVELRHKVTVANEAAASSEVTKGKFLAAVSHELRTPLNAIIGFSDMLVHEMCGPFGDPRQKEYIGLVKDSGEHLLAVVNSILDVSKIESGTYAVDIEPFRFSDAAEMCHSMMEFQATAKDIVIDMDIGSNSAEINGDRRAVQQILINLVSNAIKFTPKGGAVAIGAKPVGSRLHFWVSDTGIGIGSDDLERLGTPFMQVQNEYTRQFEGTGLGLSLVKGLVALHDGTMMIESAPGEGTTVTISLPIAGPAAKEDVAGTASAKEVITVNSEDADGALRKTG
ncbi:PAS domain-containing sensor histidine kinase [Mesorhizobium sp. NBSH29]|nr:PAS domain-containing sensor histidine kinase [Mesorhizobium sp. NBSH29]QPC87188.1 PAS domain-containing sensor histidine kinase [Mesorhizobium sp. NBSH29]